MKNILIQILSVSIFSTGLLFSSASYSVKEPVREKKQQENSLENLSFQELLVIIEISVKLPPEGEVALEEMSEEVAKTLTKENYPQIFRFLEKIKLFRQMVKEDLVDSKTLRKDVEILVKEEKNNPELKKEIKNLFRSLDVDIDIEDKSSIEKIVADFSTFVDAMKFSRSDFENFNFAGKYTLIFGWGSILALLIITVMVLLGAFSDITVMRLTIPASMMALFGPFALFWLNFSCKERCQKNYSNDPMLNITNSTH